MTPSVSIRSGAWLACVALVGLGCTTVRQLRDPVSIPTNGKAEKTRTADALDYSVATQIAAPPEVIWALLTDGPAYPSWNSTVLKIEGTIGLGQEIALTSIDAKDKVFKLRVSSFDALHQMVWEDGGSMFLGVRHFVLLPSAGGATTVIMSETYSGGMLGMIEGSLPDFTHSFEAFAADLKKAAEAKASTTGAGAAPR
jgi:hypothetical protein